MVTSVGSVARILVGEMPEGPATYRAASALRTALTATPMVRLDAPVLIGPTPRAGRFIERVEPRGRHIQLVFDNGMVLDTTMRRNSAWHVYRRGERWRRPTTELSVSIEVVDWVAVCFGASEVETYRLPDRRRHPGMGRLGPDLCDATTDHGAVVNLLLAHPDRSAPLGDVLLDEQVLTGLGNVYLCEVLWATELSPFASVGRLSERQALHLVDTAAQLLRSNMEHSDRAAATAAKGGLAVYGRNGQRCDRCGETITCRTADRSGRTVYWCPGCQVRSGPRVRPDRPEAISMDPHPAARAYLAGLPWNRDAG